MLFMIGAAFALLFFFLPTSVSAVEISNNKETFTPPPTIVGTLVSETGETEEVIGQLVEEPLNFSNFNSRSSSLDSTNSLDDNEKLVSSAYEFELYANATSDYDKQTITRNSTDGSKAVRATLRMSYFEKYTSPRQYKLSSFSVSYERLDSTVSVRNARVTWGTSGLYPSLTQQSGTTTYTNSYQKTVYYPKYVTANTGSVGAWSTMDIHRGTGKWTLTIDNQAF